MRFIRKVLLVCVFFIIILAFNSTVNAASASISTNKTSMKVGETATITVSISKSAAWNLHVSGAVTKAIVGYTDNGKNASKSVTISFKPSKKGDYKVSLNGDVTNGDNDKATNVSTSVKIKVTDSSSNTELSKDATLKNLGITPHDFTGFKKATTSYSVTVPNDTEKISIYATATNSKATVTGTGSKTLKEGSNTFTVKVTAEDKKTTKSYTLNITRKKKEDNKEENDENKDQKDLSNDATLKNLGIRPKEYDFSGFKKSVTSYPIEVPNSAEKITIYAYANNDKAQVTGTGAKTLKEGENTFSIKVTAEDKKTTKTYTLIIKRRTEEEDENDDDILENDTENETEEIDGLTNITINGYTLDPTFDTNVYEYKISIPLNTEKLDINTETSSDDYEVEIVGNEELQEGENIITILVRNVKLDKTDTYQIIATAEDSKIDLTVANKSFEDTQKRLFIQKCIIDGVIVLIVILVIVFLVEKYKMNEEMELDEDEYPKALRKKKNTRGSRYKE